MISDNNLIAFKHLHLLFVDDHIPAAAEAYSLFSPLFKAVTLAHSHSAAASILQESQIDFLIVDIELPDGDGLSLIESVRAVNDDLPIIVLSAHSTNEYLHRAANLRIDGYLTKPLNATKLNEVFNKVKSRIKSPDENYPLDSERNVFFDSDKSCLVVDGEYVSLGKKEAALLKLLISNKQQILSKQVIAKNVWPNEDMTESALKNLLGSIRKKLIYDLITTVPNKGWILKK